MKNYKNMLYSTSMLDIKFIRAHTEIVKNAVLSKKVKVDIDKLIKLDDDRLELLRKIEELRTQQNSVSDKITSASDTERAAHIEAMKEVKETLRTQEDQYNTILTSWKELMLKVPNVPDMSVPDGNSDEDNVPIKHWGEAKKFSFTPQSHIDLMLKHNMVDFERGTKVHGFRGYFLKNKGALLTFAIWNYAKDFYLKNGFPEFMITPTIVHKENFFGTGHLPNEAEDLFETQDGQNLIGTAEVATMGYFRDEVLEEAEFPRRILAFSPCFRREAGSHGKDVKGLIRVHEFYKFEQVILCEASHAKSVELHDWIQGNVESFIESLGIPYRTVINCSGDLGLGQVKKYDTELWVPGEEKYREISSASYFHDFQTRRFNIRYKDSEGKMRFAHSLNCTAIPTPRILVSLIENFQQEDGSIKIPDALVPYCGFDRIG